MSPIGGGSSNPFYNDYLNQQQNGLMQNQLHGLGQQRNNQATLNSNPYEPQQPAPFPAFKKDKSMFKEIVTDVKGFILEHRSVIYFLAFALLVDHFVFRGAFKARLQGCVDRLVTKVEEKIQ